MEPVIYIDMLFLTEGIVLYLLLYATALFLSLPKKKKRLLLSASVVSFLHCAAVAIDYWAVNGNLLYSAVLLAIGIAIAFFPRGFRQWVRLFFGCLMVSFCLSGIVGAVFSVTNAWRLVADAGISIPFVYPWQVLLWGVISAYVVLKIGSRFLFGFLKQRGAITQATVFFRGKSITVAAFWDSGNVLRSPKDGRGVPIAALYGVLPLFSSQEQICLWQGGEEQWQEMGFSCIPYQSVGQSEGVLPAFLADKLIIQTKQMPLVIENIWIGLTQEGFAGQFEILLPTCLVEEEKI